MTNKHTFTKEEVEALTGVYHRQWGYYKVLTKGDGYTVKELTIFPGKSLSDQRHFKRDEHWLVVKGTLMVELQHEKHFGGKSYTVLLTDQDRDQGRDLADYTILKETWHRPHNDEAEEVKVIETWLGDSSEEDIERRDISTIPPLP
jgi:mannose-6-phosphate isomerase-like protein (cupin superfamily)